MGIRDWLEPMLIEWGRQRRRISSGRLVRKDGSVHEDGWPTSSSAIAAHQGGITGGSGSSKQHFPEVYSAEVLPLWRALQASPIEVREIMHLHYVVRTGPDGQELDSTAKAEILGVSRKQYYIQLHEAQSYLAGRIDGLPEPASAA